MIEEVQNTLNDIEECSPSEGELASFDNEDLFVGISVDLLIEVGSYIMVATNIYRADTRCWDRNQAIIGGNMVRLYKLISAILDQTCQNRREIAFILGRLAFETIVNVKYLISFRAEDPFQSYIQYSMKHEKRLYNRINKNIDAAGGDILPIEQRMLNSIQNAVIKSEITLDELDTRQPRNWANKNVFERAQAVGLDNAYLGVFGGGSHSVHGNWMDLLDYQLEKVDGGFKAQHEWRVPRPQINMAIALLSTHAIREYFSYLQDEQIIDVETLDIVDKRIQSLGERVERIDRAHEAFLAK